jgi:hypothetical protein
MQKPTVPEEDFSSVTLPEDRAVDMSEYQLLPEYANRRYVIGLCLGNHSIHVALYDHDLNTVDQVYNTSDPTKPLDVDLLWTDIRDAINQIVERNFLERLTS